MQLFPKDPETLYQIKQAGKNYLLKYQTGSCYLVIQPHSVENIS